MFEQLIKKIARALDKAKIPYMIIGGQAVLLYGTPRLTRDIDITLGVDTDKFRLVEKVCEKLKLKILPANPENFAKDTKVLPAEETKLKIRVDFIFSFTSYEKQAINRTKRVIMGGYQVKFASCEDVIIHKMFAGRAIDEEDVKNILLKNRNSIELRYVKKWLSKFGKLSGQKELPKRFNTILKQA
ncbi:MAG: nucleotidyltransferase [Candidatus Auribacterota bacterium]|nr:nucleotidyltransferase [Candidatus Auribacterota bacterium]